MSGCERYERAVAIGAHTNLQPVLCAVENVPKIQRDDKTSRCLRRWQSSSSGPATALPPARDLEQRERQVVTPICGIGAIRESAPDK